VWKEGKFGIYAREVGGIAIRQRLQQDAVDNAEDRRAGPDAESETGHRGHGKTGRAAQRPKGKTDIIFQQKPPEDTAGILAPGEN
jgi:hypothetical protein